MRKICCSDKKVYTVSPLKRCELAVRYRCAVISNYNTCLSVCSERPSRSTDQWRTLGGYRASGVNW